MSAASGPRRAWALLAPGIAVALAAAACTAGCAAPAAPAPGTAATEPAPARPADAASVEPPVFVPAPVAATPEARDDARARLRRSILDAAWKLVRDKHYDKSLGGLDWTAVRARYEPLALGAPSNAAFYRTLNQMIGELGQSHMVISGPGAEDGAADADEVATGTADPGITVRVIENRPTITRVRAGSPAERAGLSPGFIVTQIGGRDLRLDPTSQRPLRPVEERFALRRRAQQRLMGPAGTKVSVAFLDNDDRPGQALLAREQPAAAPVELGYLPPLYPEVRVEQRGDIGILAFNIFLLQPVMTDIKRAIDGFRARGARALIIDLRGNPGGQAAMAIPIVARLVSEPLTLGTLQFRDFNQVLVARPEMRVVPFSGAVAVLTDEGTASAAEILAAGLQEAKRGVVVGDVTLGAVLPSVIEALPGGAVMQYVVADFKTPKGVLLEGRGVVPDRRVIETRAGLRSGRDPVIDAALIAVKARAGK
ncbi:MAG TPA: S41 family peptidase [Polyangia bacterium]|nr:S41 family peptidase [Polyangia bacterium]